MKVLLAGGGSSHEREVSLRSTAAMERALQELGYEYKHIQPRSELDVALVWDNSFDIVLLGFHGRAGEDGLLQSMLDTHQIPYSGAGAVDSMLAFSKDASKRLFKINVIPTANWDLLLHVPGPALPKTNPALPFVFSRKNGGLPTGLGC